MRGAALIVAMMLAVAVSADELTVNEVIAAHRAGAPVDGIVRLVREAPAVAVLAAPDLDRLRAAGVPEDVIRAMVARNTPPTPTPTAAASRPDDAALEDVVRVIRAGLSERLVCEQIRQSGQRHRLTANDLIYLKDHGVPDAVIETLIRSAATPSPTPVPVSASPPLALATPTPRPTSAPVVALVFEPVVRLSGTFRKARAGRLVLTGDGLEWTDAADPTRPERTAAASLKAVWLATAPVGHAPSPAELRVRTTAGEDVTFRDADWASGGRTQVDALYDAIRERFPQVVAAEKAGR